MPNLIVLCGSCACLLGITGVVLTAIGTTEIPTSLTRDEMYTTATGVVCSPDLCSQILTEKQRASEGVRLSIVGASLFAISTLCLVGGFLHINYCSWRRVRPTEQVAGSEQTDQ